MKPLALSSIAAMAGGTLVRGDVGALASRVSTDSRAISTGALFIALEGDRFDGHDFAATAAAAGAAGVMVSTAKAGALAASLPAATAIIAVPDTLAGLQHLASEYRKLLGARIVAITGSNGKTSAKDYTRAVLASRFATHATEGNFNNHIGLPLTILAHEPHQSHGVYELGMNHPGEIAALAAIACPNIAIITTMGTGHIEFFGTREAIAEEKMSLFDGLGPQGVAIVNLESAFAEQAIARAPGRVFTVGLGRGDLRAENVASTPDGGLRFNAAHGGDHADVSLPVPGLHMVQNALLAMAAGVVEGIPLAEAAEGLRQGKLAKGRLQVKGWRGVTIIDDTYNANPDSMTAALQTLAAQPSNARRVAVLGAMGELGAFSDEGHAMVGKTAASLGIDFVCTVGPGADRIADAAGPGARRFPDHATCARWLAGELQAGDVMLVKGSRSAAMENVLSALEGATRP